MPGVLSALAVESGPDRFRVLFRSSHREGPIHFEWEGILEGDATGTVRFAMDGEAGSTFLKNRSGSASCIRSPSARASPARWNAPTGRSCAASSRASCLPSSRSWACAPFATRWCRDSWPRCASWVTSSRRRTSATGRMPPSRPIRRHSPCRTPRRSAPARASSSRSRSASRGDARPRPVLVSGAEAVRVQVDPARRHPLPRIGLGAATAGRVSTEAERAHLRTLALDHLRVDLHLGAPGVEGELAASDPGIPGARPPPRGRAVPLRRCRGRPAWLRRSWRGGRSRGWGSGWSFAKPRPRRATVSRRRRGAGSCPLDPLARFGGGTDANFAELNRGRPSAAELDQVSFSLNPQVHATDDATLVENLASLPSLADSARAFVGSCPLALSPVTLRPRPRGAAGRLPNRPIRATHRPSGRSGPPVCWPPRPRRGSPRSRSSSPWGRGAWSRRPDPSRLSRPEGLGRDEGRRRPRGHARSSSDRVRALAFRKGPTCASLVFNLSAEGAQVRLGGFPPGARATRLVPSGQGVREAAAHTAKGIVWPSGPTRSCVSMRPAGAGRLSPV